MSMRASAARYAKALLDVAIKEANPEQAEQELTAFVALVHGHPELQAALVNPAVPAAGKRAVVQDLVDRLKPSAPVGKLLLLLADRDRLALLDDLSEVYRERLMEHLQIITAEVTTAEPLPDGRAAQMQQQLATMTGRKVMMTTRVDPAIIGGVVTKIGSTVYDGSIATQLERVKTTLER